MKTRFKLLFPLILSAAHLFITSLSGSAWGGSAIAQNLSDGSATLLRGTTLDEKVASKTVATLKNGEDGLGFYPVTTSTTIKANTAVVPGQRLLLIDLSTLEAPLTNIRNVEIPNSKSSDHKYFDLSGKPMKAERKGIYVQRNRKVILKP